MSKVSLQSVTIVSSVSHEIYLSLEDQRRGLAVVTVGEEFQLVATIHNAGRIPREAVATAHLPNGYFAKPTHSGTQKALLLPESETPIIWNVFAPSEPDQGKAEIRIHVDVEGFRETLRDTGAVDSAPERIDLRGFIDAIAGPQKIKFITPERTMEVGEVSPVITVQTQNAFGHPQKPASPITVNLTSSSKHGVFRASVSGPDIGTVTVSPLADSASFYYYDACAGTPQISVEDAAGVLKSPPAQVETVKKGQSETSVTCSPDPLVNQPVTLTAAVMPKPPAQGAPSGEVQFTGSSSSGPLVLPPAVNNVLVFTPSAEGTYTFTATYPGDSDFLGSKGSATVVVLVPTVEAAGYVKTASGQMAISDVRVAALDASGKLLTSAKTQANGKYCLDVPLGKPVQILFPGSSPSPTDSSQTLFLKSPPRTLLTPSADVKLPDAIYEFRGCQVSGTVSKTVGQGTQPLSGVQITLVDSDDSQNVYQATTDSQGGFCLNPLTGTHFTLQVPPTTKVGSNTFVLSPQAGCATPPTETTVIPSPDAPNRVPESFVYKPQLSTVLGRVTDGENGIPGITVDLTGQKPATTDSSGFYSFSGVLPGAVALTFSSPTTVNGISWELQPGQTGAQNLVISAGQSVTAQTVTYQQEQHSVEQTVTMDGKPAENVLVDVRPTGEHFASQSMRTGRDGKVTFVLANKGMYELRVYPDPAASGGPQVNYVEVNSHAVSPPVNLPRPGSGGGGSGQNGGSATENDLQAYPVLTEAVPAGGPGSALRPVSPGSIGGTSALGVMADRAIREVLSWRTKSDDPKGFVGALNQAFDLKDVEGHTEWTWTPRSYTVQTDMGAVTGAQASIYTRAKVALDQSMPLLDGFYPLLPAVEPEDLATVQAVVRSQFTALVEEFGVVGGPRVPRVDELFHLLLGRGNPNNPEDIPREASVGLVRQRFGMERRYVNTVDDEQNLTNYMILADYLIGLRRSWNYDRDFFIRTTGQLLGNRQPFFGTQLVLISRALDVVSQGVRDACFAMDSVFMGDAERQTAQLNFAGLTVTVPNPDTSNPHTFTYGPDTSGLFVAELLDWVDKSASQELPTLLQDAGKDGLESFRASTDRLRGFVHGAAELSRKRNQQSRGLPPGYHTPRVQRAIQLLANGLDEAYKLAFEVKPAEFPAELSPEELSRIRNFIRTPASGS